MFKKKEDNIPNDRKQKIFLKIKPIIARQLQIDEAQITLESKFVDDLGAESLDAIEITMALEEAFNIEILDVDVEKMITVEDVVAYLAQRVQV